MHYNFQNRSLPYLLIILLTLASSCKSGPFNVFKPTSPHEAYERKLINSGLSETAMGKTWIDLSDEVLKSPVSIEIPYLEKGYFPSEKVQATAFSFKMDRGQKLNIRLVRKPMNEFRVYTDIWERKEGGTLKLLGSADTLGNAFQSDIDRTSTYILRLQPELLAGGEYTLEITTGPSLGYPLGNYQNNQIRSFWGDGRDAGSRKHEGVDIFSAFRTPVLAIAPGTTRVNENKLGGKVVWLRPEGKDFTLYYAHLDEQTVADGQYVQEGDTLGRMGNTGNAESTPPHLHFGIYARDGAVDPLPYINPRVREKPVIKSDQGMLNATVRTTGNASFITTDPGGPALKNGTIAQVKAVSGSNYRVELPDGSAGYLLARKASCTTNAIEKKSVRSDQLQLFDRPDSSAAVKSLFKSGQTVEVLGSFGNYNLVVSEEQRGWIFK